MFVRYPEIRSITTSPLSSSSKPQYTLPSRPQLTLPPPMPNTISAPLARDDKGKGVMSESSKIPTYNALNGKALVILLPNA